jgi:hypothetical protein
MKNRIFLSVLLVMGTALVAGCASMHTWPEHERSAENKMLVIQENIGDGLKTGTLSPDQSQEFLTTLKIIRSDYEGLSGKVVPREDWDRLHGRLDVLGADITRAKARTTRVDDPRNGDRIIALQGKIDDGRINKRWPLATEREFQTRLDSIRRDYLRMTEGGRHASYEESADITRRLDALESELNRYR